MDNFWKGFEKTATKKWNPRRWLEKLRLGERVKIKNHSSKGISFTSAGKKL